MQVHDTAVVDRGASIGVGTRVWHWVHVCNGARVGTDCVLGQNVYVGPGVVIGDGVKIQNNVSVYEGVTIEDDVFVGPSAVFTNVMNPRSTVSRRDEFAPTRVCRGATIGANATIVCGNELGRWSFVGAGSVVTADVLDHALVLGNPARRVGWVCECGERLADTPTPECDRCGLRYRLEADALIRTNGR